MPELKVGLAPNKTSYFDPKTNLYLTLQKPVQNVTYAVDGDLTGITHALLASVPAIVLYEGDLPQAAIDAFKAKYDFTRSRTKRDIVENGKVIGSVPYADPIRNGMDFEGRPLKGNKAADRADHVNDNTPAIVSPMELGEAEQVDLFSAESIEAPVEDPKAEEKVEAKAPAKQKGKTKTDEK